MGLLSLFSKPKPEEVCVSIAKKISAVAHEYRREIDVKNDNQSINVGAEMLYLLLNLVDKQSFKMLGAVRRDEIFDDISQFAIIQYGFDAYGKGSTSAGSLLDQNYNQMLTTLDARQSIYGQCTSLAGDSFPSAGTMIFAFSYYVHRALGHAKEINVDDMLTCKRRIEMSDLDNFPDLPETLDISISVGKKVESLRFDKDLKNLK